MTPSSLHSWVYEEISTTSCALFRIWKLPWLCGGEIYVSKLSYSNLFSRRIVGDTKDKVLACAQGETLEQQFGEKEVCFRTLDLYTSAVLESTLNPVVQPKAEFRAALNEMSKARPALL